MQPLLSSFWSPPVLTEKLVLRPKADGSRKIPARAHLHLLGDLPEEDGFPPSAPARILAKDTVEIDLRRADSAKTTYPRNLAV